MKILLLESPLLKDDGVYRISEISYDEAINYITNNEYVSTIRNEYVKKISNRLLMVETKCNEYYEHLEPGQKAVVILVDKELVPVAYLN